MRRVGMSGWIVWWSTPRVAPVSSSTPWATLIGKHTIFFYLLRSFHWPVLIFFLSGLPSMITWRRTFLPNSFVFVRLGGWSYRRSRISSLLLTTKHARRLRRVILLGTLSSWMSSSNSFTMYDFAFSLLHFPSCIPFEISIPFVFSHNVIFCRETFRHRLTLQWGITVKPLRLPKGLLLRFGMSWQRPKREWLKAFVHAHLKNISRSHTLIMGRISFTRYPFFTSMFFLIWIIHSFLCLPELISFLWTCADWPAL